mmetsp:Transcript_14647/g.17324  ORF Transcript_14647/g.17324 Transcript_14647/m.17324 type:complete len:85 (-) Transcript_14647:76-330(-)
MRGRNRSWMSQRKKAVVAGVSFPTTLRDIALAVVDDIMAAAVLRRGERDVAGLVQNEKLARTTLARERCNANAKIVMRMLGEEG